MLLQKVHFTDFNQATFILIDVIHKNTEECIKCANDPSEKLPVQQEVKRRARLSADLYKIYIKDLIQNFEHVAQGCSVGETSVNGK